MPLKVGIIGLGRIVKSIFEALNFSDEIIISSVASRDIEKAKNISFQYGIPYYFDSYEDLIKSSHVDAVYIALPNSLHAKYCKLSLINQKPVICEKPITTSSVEFEELLALSDKYNTPLVEALMYQFNEPFLKIRQIIKSHEIGHIKFVTAVFNYSSTKLLNNDIRLNEKLGGGVVNDLLYYPVSFSNAVINESPSKIEVLNFNRKKVSRSVTAICNYQNGVKSNIQSSFDYADENYISVIGSKGVLKMKNAFRYDPLPEICVHTDKTRKIIFQNQKHRYLSQFEHLANLINKNIDEIRPHNNIVRDIQTIELINELTRINS